MITKWNLSAAPCEKDPKRFKLKLMCSEADVTTLVKRIGGVCGRPFIPLSRDFNWALYIYNFNEIEKTRIEELISSPVQESPVVPGSSAPPSFRPEGGKPPAASGNISSEDTLPSERDFWGLTLNPRYTFDNFVVGQNNRFAQAAAAQCGKSPGTTYNPFFIYGSVGLGKSHLMHAVAHEIKKNIPSIKLLITSAERFISEVIDSISRGTLQQFRDKYRALDVLMLDDIQFLAESESTQEEFFHIFNILYDNHKQIVLTSDRPPKQLVTLEDRLKSRFEWGLIADIKFPNLETRIAILKKKEVLDNLHLDDNILSYIATRLKSNIRELEGFLKRIKAYSQLTGMEIDLDMVKGLLNDLLPESEQDHSAIKLVPETAPAQVSEPVVNVPPPPSALPQLEAPGNPAHSFRIGSFKKKEEKPPAEKKVSSGLPQHFGPKQVEAPAETESPAPLPEEKPVLPSAARQAPKQAAPPAASVYNIPSPVAGPKPAVLAAEKSRAEAADQRLKPIEVAYFYPEDKDMDLDTVKNNFREVIKKHKLKFRLEGVFDREYSYQKKVTYGFFAELCKTNKINIAVVLGPPPGGAFSTEEFEMMLSAVFEDERVSFQMINYADITKPYKFLNMALDITLLKNKEMYG